MTGAVEWVGSSAATLAIRQDVDYAARSDAKVLITGESGVGKEVIARLLHRGSPRHQAPLVTMNCAGIPDSLLASELFGHVRGSFTDAHRDQIGWFERANHGTIFLDEIGEMSAQMQSLLLRFLENGEIQRLGSTRRNVILDVRVITATNRRLHERVAAGEFREDLFYRLNVVHIEIPPLRERKDDVAALLAHFLEHYSGTHRLPRPTLSAAAAERLQAADWPGNVRQLRHVVERLVLRAQGGTITPEDLPRDLLPPRQVFGPLPIFRSGAELAFERMVRDGESFWTVVYMPFVARDLTREEVRAVVRRGLELTPGGYKALTQLFNIPAADCRRMLTFLRKYDCYLPTLTMRAGKLPNAPSPNVLQQRRSRH